MVTAILPVMSKPIDTPQEEEREAAGSNGMPEDTRDLPAAAPTDSLKSTSKSSNYDSSISSPRIAGLVGICAGCGALLALGLFLPLPARLQKAGASPAKALQQSYYIVAIIAFLVAIACFFGFRNLAGEDDTNRSPGFDHSSNLKQTLRNSWHRLSASFLLAFKNADIGLAYVGGFVARASSVGLSLFIPLLVNGHFQNSGLCNNKNTTNTANNNPQPPAGLPDIKQTCPTAYLLAAQLTGTGSLIGLLAAQPFGYFSSKSRRCHLPLIFASALGIFGYILLAASFAPEKHKGKAVAVDYVAIAGVGASQIGAVVASLAVLSSAILKEEQQQQQQNHTQKPTTSFDEERLEENDHHHHHHRSPPTSQEDQETAPLLLPPPQSPPTTPTNPPTQQQPPLTSLKGSIAGTYSLSGGAGILLLTKLGGYLFDRVSFASPLYILAVFNGILLCVGGCLAGVRVWSRGGGRRGM
ncbi:MAG: hypothetical protein Q9227_005344 [Pyrenula ochraceoflavens]